MMNQCIEYYHFSDPYPQITCEGEINQQIREGILDIREPSNTSEPKICYCNLFHGNVDHWPSNGYLEVDYYADSRRHPWLTLNNTNNVDNRLMPIRLRTEGQDNIQHDLFIYFDLSHTLSENKLLYNNRIYRFHAGNSIFVFIIG